jgi:alanine dehydrogenase
MIVGVPKEVKNQEYRVGLVPGGVSDLVRAGHEVLIEKGAGEGSGIADSDYEREGGQIVGREEIWEKAGLVIKVKEPQRSEWPLIQKDQVVFTFFHLASSKELTEAMLESKAICIAYETVRDEKGHHPLLTPMSEIAGRLSIQQGAKYLERTTGGRGLLLSGVPGVGSAHVIILGGGVVGSSAAKVANGFEARVTVLDVDLDRLRYLEDVFPANVSTLYASPANIRGILPQADLVIGAAHKTGSKAPYLLYREDLHLLKEGSVLVDVAIDQGGCFETSRPTTHADPTFVEEGAVHYCVANMPGCVPRTSTYALTHATHPYVLALAEEGWKRACQRIPPLARGLNILRGQLVHRGVAEAFAMTACDPRDFL